MIPSVLQDKEGNLDFSCVLGLLTFAAFIYLSYHAYVELKQQFDAMGWGTGAGSLVALHGAGKWASNKGDYS